MFYTNYYRVKLMFLPFSNYIYWQITFTNIFLLKVRFLLMTCTPSAVKMRCGKRECRGKRGGSGARGATTSQFHRFVTD